MILFAYHKSLIDFSFAYIRKQQHEVKILNQLEARFGPKEETVICIGDWSRKSGSCIRGPSSLGPTSGPREAGMRRLLARRFPVYLIDEYRTSKVCCNCQGELKNHKVTRRGGEKFTDY